MRNKIANKEKLGDFLDKKGDALSGQTNYANVRVTGVK